jgi:hypothetical protein
MVGCVHGVWGDGPGMEYGEVPAEEQQANARLIAAAPALLAPLERAADYLGENAYQEVGGLVLSQARAAIRAAKGEGA